MEGRIDKRFFCFRPIFGIMNKGRGVFLDISRNESGVVFPAKQQDGKQDQNNPDNLYDRHALA